MPKTPNSEGSSYLPASEYLKRVDWRTVADFCSDTGAKAAMSDLTNTGTAAGANLQALLDDAAGMLEAAALAGNRYQPADLAALTGVSQKLLYRLLTDLVRGLMIERRPDKTVPVPPSFTRAMDQLELLRRGDRIFSFDETQAAGELNETQEQPIDVRERYLTATQARRFFGRRGNMRGPFPAT